MEIRISGFSIARELFPFLRDPLQVVFNFLLMPKIERNGTIYLFQGQCGKVEQNCLGSPTFAELMDYRSERNTGSGNVVPAIASLNVFSVQE